nr:hypothetical protein CFP56_21967 [Quercus suber]
MIDERVNYAVLVSCCVSSSYRCRDWTLTRVALSSLGLGYVSVHNNSRCRCVDGEKEEAKGLNDRRGERN